MTIYALDPGPERSAMAWDSAVNNGEIGYNDGSARTCSASARPSPHRTVGGGTGMAIPESTKRCSKCGTFQPPTEFYRNCATRDRLGVWCKTCERNRNRVEETASYRNTAGYEAALLKYRDSEKGKAARRSYLQRKRVEEPEKIRAREALNWALRSGAVIKARGCFHCCEMDCDLQGHHEDYSKPLDVVWLCLRCHRDADRKRAERSVERA